MRAVPRLLAATAAVVALLVPAGPSSAHDPEHGETPPPGAAGPADGASRTMHLLGRSAHTGTVNSDLAFAGSLVIQGSYDGFRIVDVSDPGEPREVSHVACRGPQGDVSVHGDLLFVSVDTPQSTAECGSHDVTADTPGMFEGIRVFDVSDPAAPRFVTGVRTDCGSHTHTLLPDPAHDRVLLYVSSYPLSARSIGPDCRAPFERISVVSVPDGDPSAAAVVAEPRVTGQRFGEQYGAEPFFACHDVTVLVPRRLAAAACLSEGQLWDLSDPLAPRVTAHVDTDDVDIWHSSAFTHDGEVVVFGDEYFGTPREPFGSVWFYPVDDPSAPLGHMRIPRAEPSTYHNFTVVPVTDRYVLVSAAYGSGTSVVDFTDPSDPREIGYYDMASNHWSTYWYNGLVVGNDIPGGLDVMRLSHPAVAGAERLTHLNPQTQELLLG